MSTTTRCLLVKPTSSLPWLTPGRVSPVLRSSLTKREDENKGDAQIFKLMKAKLDILEESIKEKFSEYLYSAGGGADPLGLASLIPDDPTTGTLGGVNRAAETQWRTS
jgi:hypothetical protein